MSKKKIQPRLRFKDDNGNDFPDWEEKAVLDIAPLQRGFDLPVDRIIEGEYPVVFSNGILKSHNEFKAKAPGVVTGRSGTIGKVTYVEKDYWPHNTSLWVTDFKNNNAKFIYYFYQDFKLDRFGTGSGVPTLNRNDVHKQNAFIPTLEEQKKIADFLSAIDNKIENLEKELEELKAYKQGVMQAIFAFDSDADKDQRSKIKDQVSAASYRNKKNGRLNNYEFIRFKDQDGNNYPVWQIKRIEDVASVNTGGKDTQNKEEDGAYPFFVRSDNVERINSYSYDGEAVLTSGDGVGVGKNFHYINGRFDYHQRVYSIHKFRENMNGKYFYYYFSFSFYQHVSKFSAKNSVDSVRKEMITKMQVPVPVLEEQKKIAGFLSALDDRIDYSTNQIENTRQYKQALLQQLFN